jgi:hypothetical protein
MKFLKLALLPVVAVTLLACGGGGSSTPAASSDQSLAAYVGTYKTGCDLVNTGDPTLNHADLGTVVINADGSIAVSSQSFDTPKPATTSGNYCASSATVTEDITVSGTAVLLPGTKTINAPVSTLKSGVVKTAEFTYTAIKISKGSIGGTLPAFGTKGKAGFLVEGNKVYVLSGTRDADGLPGSFSNTVLTKQ